MQSTIHWPTNQPGHNNNKCKSYEGRCERPSASVSASFLGRRMDADTTMKMSTSGCCEGIEVEAELEVAKGVSRVRSPRSEVIVPGGVTLRTAGQRGGQPEPAEAVQPALPAGGGTRSSLLLKTDASQHGRTT